MQRRNIARFVLGTLGFSLLGLLLCKLADRSGGFLNSGIGRALENLFIIGACVCLLALAVIILAWKRPSREEIAKRVASGEIDPSNMPATQQAAFYAAYGSLPKWLYLPFLALAVFLAVLVCLCLVGIVIWMIVS